MIRRELLFFDELKVNDIFLYDFQPWRFLVCYKTGSETMRVIGRKREFPELHDTNVSGTLRVLEPSAEERLLRAIASDAKMYLNGPVSQQSYEIAVKLDDPDRTVARIPFMSSRIGLLDVCLVYHELRTIISSRAGG